MSIPAWLTGLVDDAALFPPGSVPLDQAVVQHEGHRRADYADLVGGFVVSDVKLPDLIELLDRRADEEGQEDPLTINLVVTGGVGALEPAVRWADRAPLVRLAGLEYALRDEDDLVRNAQRLSAMLDTLEEPLADVEVFVEPPRLEGAPTHGWLTTLDELALHELPLKFRTGGVSADAFPSPTVLAASISAALDRELPFKCTAGLHNALRHTDTETGFEHHGFLNVLAATRASLDGTDAAAALEETDPDALVGAMDEATRARTRTWFRSFGSCSVLEPHHDLVELGLIDVGLVDIPVEPPHEGEGHR